MPGDYVGLSYRSGNQAQSRHGERHWLTRPQTSSRNFWTSIQIHPKIRNQKLLTPYLGTPLRCTIEMANSEVAILRQPMAAMMMTIYLHPFVAEL